MRAPEEFVERLDEEFHGKYRVRWSSTRHEWLIEQKVRRGLFEGLADVRPKNEAQRVAVEDDLIRARDGYVLTMTVTAGTTTHCPFCHTALKVPAFKTVATRCPFCAMKGRSGRMIIGYFPLSDSLIDHLRKIDAQRGGLERVTAEVDRSNQLLEIDQTMQLRRDVDAATRDRFNRLVGIPQWGYTGRERCWIRN